MQLNFFKLNLTKKSKKQKYKNGRVDAWFDGRAKKLTLGDQRVKNHSNF